MPSIFNLSIPQLRQWARRQQPDHRQLNEPVEAINRMVTGLAPPRMKPGVPVAVAAVVQFRLTQSAGTFADHLVCRTWDGRIEGFVDVVIAKPWTLRRTPFDQQVREDVRYEYSNGVTRTAYDNTDPTNQLKREEQIHPRYLVGDVLIALPLSIILYADTSEEFTSNWIDANDDSRDWKTYYEWL